MNKIRYKTNAVLLFESVFEIYKDAGWTNYTNDCDRLEKAINNSLFVLTAWCDDRLVGLLRAVGDGLTIVYIQDILVLKTFRRQGIGKNLLKQLFKEYQDVRQIVLMTDNNNETIDFYERCGFEKVENNNLQSFIRKL